MCNLYRLTKPTAEVAHLFGAKVGDVGNAGGGQVYPGYPGLVVANGELRSMVWGFPLVLKGKTGQALKPKPVNNARADKLDGFMWLFVSGAALFDPGQQVRRSGGREGGQDAHLVLVAG
jgi:putative SOS response-associated peptidase YedK